MSTTIDQRVVEMQFDNRQFESNVKTSVKTLDNLKRSLDLSQSAKGLEQVNTAAKNLDMSQMSNGIETVKAKFSSLQVVGATVLANLTTSAMNAARKIANALTNALVQGGWNRAMNIEQAKFQLEGLGYAWEDVAEDIDYAVKGTAYGLDAAAKACSQLVASNVQIGDDMKTALRGISGVAAMTNSSYEDISHIFTRVAGNGRVYATDLQSISSRGINAAAALGKHIGKTEAQIRDMVSDGEIDFATFAKAMDSAFGEHAKDANKTFTGALSNTKAALSRIGADVAGPALINLRDVFNGLRVTIDDTHKSLKPFIEVLNNAQNAITKMAVKFIELGGLKSILNGIGNIFKGIWSVIKPIKEAFTDIFPMGTVEQLVEATKQFGEITKKFKLSEENSSKLKDTFKGLFAVLDILVDGVKALGKGVIEFLGNFKGLGGVILSATASLGKFLVKMRDGVKAAEVFRKIVDAITEVLEKLINKFKEFKNYIIEKFDLQGLEGFSGVLQGIWNIITKLGSKIVEFGKMLGDNLSTDKIQAAMGIAGAILMIRNACLSYINIKYPLKRSIDIIKAIFDGAKDFLGLGNSIKGAFSALNSSLWSLNRTLKYEQLMNYAKALALLAASMLLISLIDTNKLAASLGAITVLIAELTGVMVLLDKMSRTSLGGNGIKGFVKGFGESIIGIEKARTATMSLIKMALAVLILAGALKTIGSMNLPDIAKGLGGVIALMLLLIGTMKILESDGGKVIKGAGQMVVMAIALTVLTGALKIVATMSWEELGKGLAGLLGITIILVAAARMMQSEYKTITKFAGQMFIMAASLTILAGVLKIIATMSWEELGKGLAGIAGLLIVLGVTMKAMSSISGKLGTSAASILVMAVAIKILAGAFETISSMSWESIAKSLGTVAGALLIFGLAAFALSKIGATTSLLLLASAVAIFGVGILAIGVGLVAAAAGISALAVAVVSGASSIVAGLNIIILGFINLIPAIAVAIAEGLKIIILSLLDVLVESIPAIVDGIGKLILNTLDMLVTYTPQIVTKIFDFLINVINTLAVKTPELITAVVNMLMAVLQGVLDALKSVDPKVLVNGILAVGLLTALMTALAAMVVLAPLAMIGVLGTAAVITELAFVLAAIGALGQIPGLQWLVSEGGNFLQVIGTAIGKFLGGLVGGFSKGISAALPEIGLDLSRFMINMMPFIFGVKMIDGSVLKGTTALLGIMVELAAARIINGISKWLSGGSSLVSFGMQLVLFAPFLVKYADIIKDLDTKAVTASAKAAQMLVTLANDIPNCGGLVSLFAGENSLADFGMQLVPFGAGMAAYSKVIADMDSEAVAKSAVAGKALAELAKELPNAGGLVSLFAGDNNLASFGLQLIPFGLGMAAYSKAVSGMDTEAVTKSITAAKALTEIANNIPNSGGIAAWFAGDNSIARFGTELIALGAGLRGFSDIISQGDGINIDNVKAASTAAKALVEIANNVPNSGGIVTWFTGDNSIARFGTELIALGAGLRGFSDIISQGDGLNADNIKAATTAAKALADLTNHIPNSGGMVTWFTGDNSIARFGTELIALGAGLRGFSDIISQGDGLNIDNIKTASTAAETLAGLTNHIPNSGGVTAWFTGDNSIARFGAELIALGAGLRGFSDIISQGDGLNNDAIVAAATAAEALAGMTNIIPNNTGMAAWFAGKSSVAVFGAELIALGAGLRGFSDIISQGDGINVEAIVAAATAAEALAAVTNIVSTSGGMKALISGEYDLVKFGSELTSLGAGIKGFSDEVSADDGINTEQIAVAANAAKTLGEMASNIGDKTGKNVASFGKNLKTFGEDLKVYFTDISGIEETSITTATKATDAITKFVKSIDPEMVKQAAKAVSDMVDALKDTSRIKEGSTDGFVSAISELGEATIDELLQTFKDSATKLNNAGKDAIKDFIDGVEEQTKTAKEDCSDSAIKCADAMRSITVLLEFESAGKDVVEGFSEGITNNTWMAEAKARAMARASATAAKNELDINSPSKVFMGIGSSIPEGFAKGISKYAGMVSKPITEMSRSAVNGISKSITRISDLVNSNIDAQPTIRPVLDLSDVTSGANAINGMFGMQPSVGVLSNVSSISASMNKRQNGATSDDVVSAIKGLRGDIAGMSNNTYQINGVTYDDGSNVAEAVSTLVRAVRIERRK